MKDDPQSHALRLFLDSPLYLALIQFQATNKLGRSYAGLLVFIEGLRKLNFISEVVYQYYRERYMKPLQTNPMIEKPIVTEKREQELQKARKQLEDIIELFPKLKVQAQKHWLNYALEHPEIPESTELLRKYGEGMKF